MIQTLINGWLGLPLWAKILIGWSAVAVVAGLFIGAFIRRGRHPLEEGCTPHICPEAARGKTDALATIVPTPAELAAAQIVRATGPFHPGDVRPSHHGKPTLVQTTNGWRPPSPSRREAR